MISYNLLWPTLAQCCPWFVACLVVLHIVCIIITALINMVILLLPKHQRVYIYYLTIASNFRRLHPNHSAVWIQIWSSSLFSVLPFSFKKKQKAPPSPPPKEQKKKPKSVDAVNCLIFCIPCFSDFSLAAGRSSIVRCALSAGRPIPGVVWPP